jgi:hypothetical protein
VRITHKAWPSRDPKPVEITPEYQAEVDRSTEKLERRYRLAQKAVETARFRRERAGLIVGHAKLRRKRIAEAEAALEARLAELADLERMMTTSPASARHRGVKSFTKVPK